MDLFNNPMIEAAKQAMTPEQIEDYKRIGEYMYNSVDYKSTVVPGVAIREAKTDDLLLYAVQALRSGGDPKDLTKDEINALSMAYGDKWYESFDIDESELPEESSINIAQQVFEAAEKNIRNMKLPRKQRRAIHRRQAKDRKQCLKTKTSTK